MKERRRLLGLCFFVGLFGVCGNSVAQLAGATTVEGYVLNRRDGLPVSRALVEVNLKYNPSTGLDSATIAVETDGNGFFTAPFIDANGIPPSNVDSIKVVATCRTKTKTLRQSAPLPSPYRTDVTYGRNIYFTMPNGEANCQKLN